MQQVVQPCHPLFTILFNSVHHESNLVLRKMHQLSMDRRRIHHTHRLIFTFHYTFLFNSVHHKSNLFLRKMHQLSVDGAMGGPGVVDYRKGCLIILTTIVLRDIPCISSKALSLPECDHSYRCLIIVTTIFLSVYPPKTCAFPLRSFLGRAA